MSVSYHNIHQVTHRVFPEWKLMDGLWEPCGRQSHVTLPLFANQSLIARFWAHVTKTDTCWLWTGSLDTDGYGQIARSGGLSPIKAHRLSWLLHVGPVTSSVHILHRCDVRNCVSPYDLFEGDQATNMKDAAAKGRLGGRARAGRKLSSDAEREIKDIYSRCGGRLLPGLRSQLARRFGISNSYLSMIGRGMRTRMPVMGQGR